MISSSEQEMREELFLKTGFSLPSAVQIPNTPKNRRKLETLRAGFKVRKVSGTKTYFFEINQTADLVVDLFFGLVQLFLGKCDSVDLFLESYYQFDNNKKVRHLAVRNKEYIIVISILEDFETMLLNDANISVSLSSECTDIEVSLVADKTILIHIYDGDLHTIRRVKTFLRGRQLKEDDCMKAVYEFFHFHEQNDILEAQFERFVLLTGAYDESEEQDDIEFC